MLGEQAEAEARFEKLLAGKDRYAWLARWDIRATTATRGEEVKTLYGPDPSQRRED